MVKHAKLTWGQACRTATRRAAGGERWRNRQRCSVLPRAFAAVDYPYSTELAPLARLERAASYLGGTRSIHLSYRGARTVGSIQQTGYREQPCSPGAALLRHFLLPASCPLFPALLARPVRFERTTYGSGGHRSIQAKLRARSLFQPSILSAPPSGQ